MSVIGSTLIDASMVPLSTKTGATSKSDPNAGDDASKTPTPLAPITTADKAGAAILTILVCVAMIGSMIWIVLE
jgi:mannan endo-1,6-alpha-mannosidase